MEENLRFKIDWASLKVGRKFTVFALFYFVFEGNFPSTSPRGAYIWRGLYMEGLIFGILRYLCDHSFEFRVATPNTIVRLLALDDYELYECFFRKDFWDFP